MTPLEVFKAHPATLIAKNLVILGAVALFLIGVQQKNYIADILGANAKFAYILIGLAGVFLAYKEAMWFIAPATTAVTATPA